MKRLLTLFFVTLIFHGYGQVDQVSVDPFSRVMIHPYFQVEFKKGTTEKIEFLSSTVDLSKINVEVSGRTLHLYLDDAKVAFRRMLTDPFDKYRNGTRVKAIITYTEIEKLSVYGEERIAFLDDIDQRKLQLKIYGDADVRFERINTGNLKVGLYGDNKLSIEGGDVSNQVYNSYGDNVVNARRLHGDYLKFVNFGDNELHVGEYQYVKLTSFGDATISYIGDPILDKKITLGETTYVHR